MCCILSPPAISCLDFIICNENIYLTPTEIRLARNATRSTYSRTEKLVLITILLGIALIGLLAKTIGSIGWSPPPVFPLLYLPRPSSVAGTASGSVSLALNWSEYCMKYSTTSTIIDIDGGTAQRRNVETAAKSCFALSCKLLDDDAICRSDWTAIYLVCFDGLFRVLAKGQGWLGQSIALNYCNANECCCRLSAYIVGQFQRSSACRVHQQQQQQQQQRWVEATFLVIYM